MKQLVRSVVYKICSIIIFSAIYWLYSNHFLNNNNKIPNFIDCLFLSVTVEAGVGYTDLNPITNVSKVILMLQQFLMITSNIFLLYIFTI